jgi:hypothetical protein
MSVAFWRRFASWSRVRDVRLVVIDGPITSEPVIEVVFNESSASWLRWRLDSQRGFWLINVRLFGWSPDMLIGEMKRWQRGHAGA